MRKTIFMLVAICFVTSAFGQKGKLNSAKTAYASGDYKPAYTAIEAASKHDKTKDLAETWIYKAQIYSAIQTQAESLQDILGVKISEDELVAVLDKAQSYNTDGKYDDQLEEAVQNVITNKHNLGVQAFNKNKDYPTAIKLFNEKINFRETYLPNNSVDTIDYLVLAGAHFNVEEHAKGVEYYEKLIDLNYDDKGVYDTVINYYRSEDDGKNYLAALKKAQEAYPDINNYKLLEIDHYVKQGTVDEILPDMLSASEKEPNNVGLLNTIASVYKGKGENAKEREWLQKALAVDSENLTANFNLGVSYFNEAVKHNDTMNFEMSESTPKYIEAEKERNRLAALAKPLFDQSYSTNPDEPALLEALIQYSRMMGQSDLLDKYKSELEALN